MISIQDIATILRDKGLPVRLTKTHGYIGDVFFTREYARFGKNPNLYYFKPNAASAADFIEEGSATLSWTDEDWARSLECEKDELYFVCEMYKNIVQQPRVSFEESRDLYFLFKGAVEILLSTYSERYKLPHGGMDLKCFRAEGRHYSGSNKISFNTDLIMSQPNHIKSVVLHELCHSAFSNHRRKFWQLLQELMVDAGLTSVTGYVVPELFGRRKDYYITIPIIHGGPDLRFRSCLLHPNMFKEIKSKNI